ncbi:YuiB family protein [Indiicoccus explosivorum]|uniref:YuiB family protein n=1 Tax=Indiicoccus explosivorum TaxID=1917864 RepID=UPI000B445D6D|nr:YuiB family protein [Indiicoccus explosivorum]
MEGSFSLVQLIISMLLFFVMFFGIGFLLNMLLRVTWFMAIVYPVVVLLIIDEVGFFDYITDSGRSFSLLGDRAASLAPADIAILTAGFAGAVTAGIVMRILRKMGYRMF